MGQATAQRQQQPPAQQEQQRTQQQGQQQGQQQRTQRQQGQQRQTRQQQECTVGQQADMEMMRQVQSSQVRRDLRTLRDAALLLKEYDKQGACQQVVTAIQDVARERGQQAMAQQQQRGQEGQQQQAQQQQGQQQRDQQAQRRQQAEPATQAAQNLGVDQMLESDVIGANGDVVGEVTDIVLSKEGQPQYVVVAFGGFLGLGEDRVAIPFDMLRMRRPQEEGEAVTFYVPMTEQKLTDAPRIRPEQDWQQNEQWQSQNRQYFEQNRQKT
jgi:sporulation protein YlmC with PRC-barrel domain